MKIARRIALLFVAFLLVNASSHGAQAASLPKLGSTVFQWNALNARTTANGDRREVADQPTATFEKFECHVTTLNPGNVSHAPHQHPQEELIILKEGTLDVTINGIRVCRAGEPDQPSESVDLKPRAVHLLIDLKIGNATATIRTNYLTHDYVHENSAYAS